MSGFYEIDHRSNDNFLINVFVTRDAGLEKLEEARTLSELALVLAVGEPVESKRVLELIDDESLRRKTGKAISRGE